MTLDDELTTTALVRKDPTFTAALCFDPALSTNGIGEILLEQYSAPEAYVLAKKWGDVFGEVTDTLRDKAINGCNTKNMMIEIGGRTVAQMTEKNLPAKWSYEDETLDRLNAQMEQIKIDIKARQAKLQAAKADVPDSNGETLTPARKVEQGMTVSVKFL
jgi:hypothetical protein